MDLRRTLRHLFYPASRVDRAFPNRTLAAIETAIGESERRHGGEIRFVVEGALDGAPLFKGQSARQRAVDLFSQLRVWDTEANNGVLIYLLLADHDVELVADRGLAAKVAHETWEAICHAMESDFRRGDFDAGVLRGIAAIDEHLARHFPAREGDRNELPDRPLVFGGPPPGS